MMNNQESNNIATGKTNRGKLILFWCCTRAPSLVCINGIGSIIPITYLLTISKLKAKDERTREHLNKL